MVQAGGRTLGDGPSWLWRAAAGPVWVRPDHRVRVMASSGGLRLDHRPGRKAVVWLAGSKHLCKGTALVSWAWFSWPVGGRRPCLAHTGSRHTWAAGPRAP